MLKKLEKFKAVFLAFGLAFAFVFFISIFWNPPVVIKQFDENHHFYLNRGYPRAWAGVSALDKDVDFPIVKAPFILIGSILTKVIDLRVFIPLLIGAFLFFYLISLFFVEKIKGKKYEKSVLITVYLILLFASWFYYYYWFPRW